MKETGLMFKAPLVRAILEGRKTQTRRVAPKQSGCPYGEQLSDRGHIALEGQPATGPTNGFWRDADWLLCRDGKWRATQSIVIEMADGIADRLGYSRFGDRWSLNPLIQKAEKRVGRLRGYGNAINAEQAKAFIKAFMEVRH